MRWAAGLEITMACDFVIAADRAIWGMPEVDSGLTPGWGGTTRMARYIGKRRTKEINIIGALMPAQKAVDWGLWNRTVPADRLDDEVEALLGVLRVKNQQACRQLKYIINRGCETDLYTAQGFEMLSGSLSGAVNGFWQVEDADQGRGIENFSGKGSLWELRRGLAKNFWGGLKKAGVNPSLNYVIVIISNRYMMRGAVSAGLSCKHTWPAAATMYERRKLELPRLGPPS